MPAAVNSVGVAEIFDRFFAVKKNELNSSGEIGLHCQHSGQLQKQARARPAVIRADEAPDRLRVPMRADDHQLLQPLVVSVMERVGAPGVPNDVEGSGYGFRVLRRIDAAASEMPTTCRMARVD